MWEDRRIEAIMLNMGGLVRAYKSEGMSKVQAHERLTEMVLSRVRTETSRQLGELAFDTLWEIDNV
jgi:hypothetical protein